MLTLELRRFAGGEKQISELDQHFQSFVCEESD
jgi:hypothetical protein